MASVKYETDSTVDSVMTTALNSLADDSNAISGEFDNSAGDWLFADLELSTATLGYTPASGAVTECYIVESLDGTNFADGDGTIDPASTALVGAFPLRASTAAQRHQIRGVTLPPRKFKIVVVQKTGGTFPSSGNELSMLKYRFTLA